MSRKPAKKKPNGKANGKAKKIKRSPRSRPLPGMEQVRSRALDNVCEAIGDCRTQLNEAKKEEQQHIASALQKMTQQNVSVYRHAGVELARIPGAEKLRVRLTKEEGDADESDLETGAIDAPPLEGEDADFEQAPPF